ncbi:TIGR03086 family protein [Nocardioides sp. TRM66260-LWL]|uniref:TIGR03086 family metal-binding protein n=1 Tax=Nocardioides sp. TRM66260-LWL TaxID=2874478 RepID=UPI001CC517CA|nr:TIGR03086 family metal-binding protein [Nocardioides sp. TRM66260-LWL]MBZ5735447.1 TIGR03086 family protein [Nocardioides sp. TRM66260-LWL]
MSPITATPSIPDLRPALLDALAHAEPLVLLAAGDLPGLDRPTPCDEYDLRTLLGHLLTVVERIRVVTAGGHFSEVPQVTVVPDDERADAWHAAVARLRDALPLVDLARPVTAPFGTLPAGAVLISYVGEVAVHTWDLAAAVDRRDLLDAAVAAPLLAAAMQRLPAQGRAQMPFGDVVPVADDAGAFDRLVGWFGRRPDWRP